MIISITNGDYWRLPADVRKFLEDYADTRSTKRDAVFHFEVGDGRMEEFQALMRRLPKATT